MAVPSSGQLREYADIGVELGVAQANVSLRGMSQTAGFSTPDAMSEFYGYSGQCTTGVADVFGDGSGIALYQLDNNVSDASGNYSGLIGTTPIYDSGYIAASIRLPSASSKGVELTNIPNRMLVNSVSFWFKKPSTQPAGEKLMFWLRRGLHTWIGFSDNQLVVRTYDGSTESLSNPVTVNNNQWYHFCLVSNGSAKSIYLNGTNYQNYSQADFNTQDLDAETWLYHYNTSGISSTCNLDQVRIFNKAISASEVTSLYGEQICTNIVGGDNFNTVLYTGNNTARSITGLTFEPGLVWIKARTASYDNLLYDISRGVEKEISTNLLQQEITRTNSVTSFNSNGFSIGNINSINNTGYNYVAWCWKAGGAPVTNSGTIPSVISANANAGFSVVKYSPNSNTQGTINHGLSTAPNIVIIKKLNDSANFAFNSNISPLSYNGNWLIINRTNGIFTSSPVTSVDQNSVTIKYDTQYNASGSNYVAYCFSEVSGYSGFGSYVGTNAAGNKQTTGFRPSFILIKAASGTYAVNQWYIFDDVRQPTNPNGRALFPSLADAEVNFVSPNQDRSVNLLDDGFSFNSGAAEALNGPSTTYIYMAFA